MAGRTRKAARLSQALELTREGGLLIAVFGPLDALVQRYAEHPDPANPARIGTIHWSPVCISLIVGMLLMAAGILLEEGDEDDQ